MVRQFSGKSAKEAPDISHDDPGWRAVDIGETIPLSLPLSPDQRSRTSYANVPVSSQATTPEKLCKSFARDTSNAGTRPGCLRSWTPADLVGRVPAGLVRVLFGLGIGTPLMGFSADAFDTYLIGWVTISVITAFLTGWIRQPNGVG